MDLRYITTTKSKTTTIDSEVHLAATARLAVGMGQKDFGLAARPEARARLVLALATHLSYRS
jgi:hypothetical protein